MDATISTVIGAVAASLATFGFVPQILKIWRSKSVGDVSVVTFYQFTAGVILWAIYGYFRDDFVVIIANVVALVTLVIALTLYYRYKTGPLQRLMLLTLRAAQEIGADTTLAVRRSTHGIISGIVAAGGDAVAIAEDAIYGAIAAANSAGLRSEEVGSAAAAGAVEAAAEVSQEAKKAVSKATSDILEEVEMEQETK